MKVKKDISILLINAIDKFDTSLYGFLAPLLGPVFFPHDDQIVQLMLIYVTSLTSIIARPCGMLFFGALARTSGPSYALLYSVMGISLTTILIGCIPAYASISWYAPICLLIMRLLRGICASGESTVAKLYIMEQKEDCHALRVSHWYQCSSMIGIIAASFVSTVAINAFADAWRVCFLFAGVITFIALYIRNNSIESSDRYTDDSYTYENIHVGHHIPRILAIAMVTLLSHITYSVPFVFFNSFIPLVTPFSFSTMMRYNTGLLLVDMIAVPSIGYYTQRYNAAYIMIVASAILGSTIVPLFYFLPAASLSYVLFVRIWIILWGVMFLCPLNFWSKNLFTKEHSYILVGVGNALGGIVGQATTPLCLWLWYATECVYAPALYCAFVMILTVYVITRY